MIGMIWAQGHDRAIGRDGALPWHVPEDMRMFRDTTRGHTVIMGRNTWESLGDKYRPLPGRRNIVVTRNPNYDAPGAELASSIEEAIKMVEGEDLAWVMGGAQLYRAALPYAELLQVTDIDVDVDGADAFAPELPEGWVAVGREPETGWAESSAGPRYRFTTYELRLDEDIDED